MRKSVEQSPKDFPQANCEKQEFPRLTMTNALIRHSLTAEPPEFQAEEQASAPPPAREPGRATSQSGIVRVGGIVACAATALWALSEQMLHTPSPHTPSSAPLFAFFCLLSLLAVLLPATGPRGQRVGLLPAVGLSAALLLPPILALLPLLLANTAYAFTRDLPRVRRAIYERGVWLGLAALTAGGLHTLMHPALSATAHTPLDLLLVSLTYGAVYIGGRLGGMTLHFHAARTVRRHVWVNWKLEAATLAAAAPLALLMALSYPASGLLGTAGAAVLLVLLLVVAHFGFETAILREQVRAMEKISALSVAQTSLPKVIERFLTLGGGLVPSDRASFWLTDDSQTLLERIYSTGGAAPASVRFGEGLVGRAAERRTPCLVRDGLNDPRRAQEEVQTGPPCSLLLLPLVAGEETLGVARFERDAPGAFTPRELTRLRALAAQTAATLANVLSHQNIYNQAVTDGLTGLYNRRYVQSALVEERRRAQRYGHPLSVVMLDVDSFKSYNDTYGHVQGDVLLKKMASILQGSVRDVDIVGRYGGEEFIIVMPETPSREAYQIAERLRQAVARTVFPGFAHDPELAVYKTISLGVATFPDDTDDTHALVNLADGALYRAKHGGRNQTVLAGECRSEN